jgi:hypothetical protein
MKYKGFEIIPSYGICGDWKLDKNGTVVPKRPKKEDIEWYQILDNGRDWIREFTIVDCKRTINDFLFKNGLKKNTID